MLFSIFLISVAVLAYEIILMRIFSITQWYHFAYMIISIALLGFGASGTFISLLRSRLTKKFSIYYRLFSFLFSLSIAVSYFLNQQNRFNPFEIVWNSRQYLYLAEYYLELFVPFFFAATCIGLLFTQYTSKIGLLYCYNLIGSGVGALGAVAGLYVIHPVQVLYIIMGVALCGTIVTCSDVSLGLGELLQIKKTNRNKMTSILIPGCLLLLVLMLFSSKYDLLHFRSYLNISQYKGLSLAKNFPDAKILTESVSPLGVVHTVSSPVIRNAPGLSLNYTGDVPSQLAIFIDSGNAGTITNPADVGYLDFLTSSLAYHIRLVSTVLILGAGGGTDVLNALVHQAQSVDAVEMNPQIIELVHSRFQDFSGHLYDLPNVQVIQQEARGYIESTQSMYDLVQISLLDAFGASAAGVYALHENYLYTIEALKRYYSRLTPQGILSITRWVKFPPRDNIKLFATAIESLEAMGISSQELSRRLISIRSWATCTLLVSKTPFSDEEIERVRGFCRERSFDSNYFPGMSSEEANIYNQIPSPEYYRAAQELLFGDKNAFYASYPYFVRPARDDSPYFFHFFTWRSLPALLRTMGKEWIPFIEWGYLVLLATLLQAGIISVILIIIPLYALPRRIIRFRYKLYTVIYFTCLGLGYLFLEMVFIQKFTFFLANPIHSASVVIASFLIFSGFGSLYFEVRGSGFKVQGSHFNSQFRSCTSPRIPHNSLLFIVVVGIVGLSGVYIRFLPFVFSYWMGWDELAKITISVVFIAPLGFCMGIPFPLGLKRLTYWADELVPWAYGINGCASVLSSLIATGIAILSGFQAVVFLAGLLYTIAAGIGYVISKHL